MEQHHQKISIAIIGAGYVGLSLGALFGQSHKVSFLDINQVVINKINAHESPLQNNETIQFFENNTLDISATSDPKIALDQVDYIIISTPTDFDDKQNSFDVTSVEASIQKAIMYSPNALIIIKSTVPVGFTDQMKLKYSTSKIIFCPEFLREGQALHDNLYPSRIIIGGSKKDGENFANMLKEIADVNNTPILFMNAAEAESVKLFANTYLAMRVAYFNELDNFSMTHDLETVNIISGISSDPRIGDFYNNPSFGYGGYCLPKDTQQLLSSFADIPNTLIQATIESNKNRKVFIADHIISLSPNVVGVFELAMKSGSENSRFSAILDVIRILKTNGLEVIIYEPSISESSYLGCLVENNFETFVHKACLIIANRNHEILEPVQHKVFTRDIFRNN
jgi:UDPglucose 6-dehydrogenase